MSVSRCAGWLLAGRYRLLSELGRGGMGRVWRAHDELLDRQVAVKEVTLAHQPGAERERLLGRTMREARLAARLSHPNIAAVYDVVVADERPWIVLQLVPARSLADVIAERGPLPVPEAARVGLQVLDALRAAHDDGIVHRDVKPGNILLNGDRHALLTDFGLATTLDDQAHLTQTGMVVGTPAYIAPERLRGGPATPKADLWSLGATLYAAVEGQSPFPHSGQVAALTAVLTSSPEPFRHAGPLVPVIAGLLEKDPARRMDAAEAHRRLTHLTTLHDAPSPAAFPETGAHLPPPATDALEPTATAGAEPSATAGVEPSATAGAERAGTAGRNGRRFGGGRHLAPFSAGVPQLVLPSRWRQAAAVTALLVSVLVTTSWSADEAAVPTAPHYAEPGVQQVAEDAAVMHAVAVTRPRPTGRGSARPPAAGATDSTSGKTGSTAGKSGLNPGKGHHKGLTRGRGHGNAHGHNKH